MNPGPILVFVLKFGEGKHFFKNSKEVQENIPALQFSSSDMQFLGVILVFLDSNSLIHI